VLTLDALDVGRFSRVELDVLQAFAEPGRRHGQRWPRRMHGLAARAEDERLRADSYAQAAGTSGHGPAQLIGHSPRTSG
jgi:anaerobic nitric oxide reductase transcription regulator